MSTDTTGLDLQFERRRAVPKVQARDIASVMGISSSRVSRIENDPRRQTERMVERYRAALETCRTSGTEAA